MGRRSGAALIFIFILLVVFPWDRNFQVAYEFLRKLIKVKIGALLPPFLTMDGYFLGPLKLRLGYNCAPAVPREKTVGRRLNATKSKPQQ